MRDEPRFASREEYERYEMRRRADEYYHHSQPIIMEMVKLKALFSSPWMVANPAGEIVDSGEDWTDAKAAALYRQYEESLELLSKLILNAP